MLETSAGSLQKRQASRMSQGPGPKEKPCGGADLHARWPSVYLTVSSKVWGHQFVSR